LQCNEHLTAKAGYSSAQASIAEYPHDGSIASLLFLGRTFGSI